MKNKTTPIALIIIGVIALVTSLSFANSKTTPEINMPKIEAPELSAPEVKLPIVGNIKILNANNSKTNDPTESSPCSGSALCTTDEVTKIIDGDTIYTEQYQIRLALVNTPEKYQDGFSDARSFTKKTCPVGSIVAIDQDDGQKIDVYGRIVAKVTCSDTNLNAALLENGHANILKQYCSKSEFSTQTWAKTGC